MESCDVLIVGGGPAGSSCAWRLRGSGLDVVVRDAKPFPRDKVCAGWITPPIVDELEIPQDEYAKQHVLQPIRGFQVGLLGASATRVDYGETVSFGIRRCELDDYLLARSGARLELGSRVRELRRDGERWIADGALAARVVVGAGGSTCPVARALGAGAPGSQPVVAAQEIEFEMDAAQRAACPTQGTLPELYFTPDLAGYGWIVRKQGFLNVGLGSLDGRSLGGRVRDFVARLEDAGRLPPGVPERFRGHAYRLCDGGPRRVHGEAALLAGDAAGLAYPRSGEGIRPAVESGLLAAEAVVAAGGRYTARRLEPYARALERRYGRGASRQLTAAVPRRWRVPLAARLLSSPWFARRVVLDAWFLHRDEPSLPSLAEAAA